MDFNDISDIVDVEQSPVQQVDSTVIKLKKRSKGRPRKPGMHPKMLRLNLLFIKELDALAEKEGLSASQLVIKAVKLYKDTIN